MKPQKAIEIIFIRTKIPFVNVALLSHCPGVWLIHERRLNMECRVVLAIPLTVQYRWMVTLIAQHTDQSMT